MENVAGYEDYEKEFREVSLPEYRWLAQTMLTQAIEDSGCQMDGTPCPIISAKTSAGTHSSFRLRR